MKPQTYSVQKKPWATRGPAIYFTEGSTCYPVCYLRKPKYLSEANWQKVLDAIRVEWARSA